MLLAALFFCLIFSFMLSGAESAVLAVSRVRVRHAAENGDARAKRLLPLLEDRDSLLGCITVGNHLANLAAFLLVAVPLARHATLERATLVFVVALPLFLLLLEVIPKKLFRRFPFRSLRAVTPLLRVVSLASPLFRVFASSKKISVADDAAGNRRREDIKALSESLAEQGQLSAAATGLIGSVLDFHQKSTGEFMVPLERENAAGADMPLSEALKLAHEKQLSLLPVVDGKGDYCGVLDVAVLPPALPADRLVRQHLVAPMNATEQAPVLTTLQRLRKQGRRVALVVDATGKPKGLITEDLLLAPLTGC